MAGGNVRAELRQGAESDGCWRGTDLVYEVLAVIVAELLGTNDAVKIGLHKLLDEVDLLEVIERGRTEDVEYGDDVLVVEVTE